MRLESKLDGTSGLFTAFEGEERIGEVTYSVSEKMPNRITVTHVGVDAKHRGGGKAKQVMMAVVEYARENGKKITPVCSYAKATFERYPEIADVLYRHDQE